jgi:hypothetical protein
MAGESGRRAGGRRCRDGVGASCGVGCLWTLEEHEEVRSVGAQSGAGEKGGQELGAFK